MHAYHISFEACCVVTAIPEKKNSTVNIELQNIGEIEVVSNIYILRYITGCKQPTHDKLWYHPTPEAQLSIMFPIKKKKKLLVSYDEFT